LRQGSCHVCTGWIRAIVEVKDRWRRSIFAYIQKKLRKSIFAYIQKKLREYDKNERSVCP